MKRIFINTQGFSLVELLITIATVAALTGVSLSVYSQYQSRAYNSTALQQGVQVRTALEAGLSDRGSLGSTAYANNPSLEYAIDGTLTCVSGCDDIDPSALLSGFVPNRGVKIFLNLFEATQSMQVQVGHCRALTQDGENYNGWLVSDTAASQPYEVVAEPSDIAQCSDIITGGNLDLSSSPTSTATPTSCDPGGALGQLCQATSGSWDANDCICSCLGTQEFDSGSGCQCPGGGVWSGSQCHAPCGMYDWWDDVCSTCVNNVSCGGDCTSVWDTNTCGCVARCGPDTVYSGNTIGGPTESCVGSCIPSGGGGGPVCGDASCDIVGGETAGSCYQDCGTCGDALCTVPHEDNGNCPIDCP